MQVRVSVQPILKCASIRSRINAIEEMLQEETELEVLKDLRGARAGLRAEATRLSRP